MSVAQRITETAAFCLMLLYAVTTLGVDLDAGVAGQEQPVLHGAVKISGLYSHAGDDEVLFPETDTRIGLGRARFILASPMGWNLNGELAYEQRIRAHSSSKGGSYGGVLPPEGVVPFRMAPLDWQIAESGGGDFLFAHEIDRALIAWKGEGTQATLGRQAIGLGRGVLFSVVDVFAPFSPTEVDREWRPGVDAIRVEQIVADAASAEAIAAFGESWEESAVLGRVRGYTGKLDAEFIGGKLGEDVLSGVTVSGAAGEAEIHAEMAVFHTPEEQSETGLLGNRQLVANAVAGSSCTFGIGQGVTLLGEYRYSEFSADSIEGIQSRSVDPVRQARSWRGGSMGLGRHVMGVRISCPVGVAWNLSLMGLFSATDGSGLMAPAVSWNSSRRVTVVASGQLPWGELSSEGRLQSEYGATPASLFLQVTVYY